MDNVFDYNNFEVLKTELSRKKLRKAIRLLCVFGCGAGEVIFATKDDKVYGFGRNRFGGLGLGTVDEHIDSPALNQTLSDKQLSNIYCGFEHWIALTSNGRCYAWGHNDFGQLGIGTVEATQTPLLIQALKNIEVVDIGCGGFYNIALTRDGLIYGWGHNQFGQLGDGSYDSVTVPKRIDFNEKIASISCGIKHSMALTDSGRLYVWGLNSYGQLGREVRRPPFFNHPESVPGLEDTVFAKAECGPNHSLLLTNDGFVYAFGDNKGGQIGNGLLDHQCRPFKVFDNIKCKDIIGHKENDISIAISMDNKFFVWGLAKNRRYLTPKEIISGDSIFDIYAKVVKTGVTFKTIVINEKLKSWEKINKSFDPKNNNFTFSQTSDDNNEMLSTTEESLISSAAKRIANTVQSLNQISNENNRTIYDFLDIEGFKYYDLMSIDANVLRSVRLLYVFQRGNSAIFATNDDQVFGLGFNRNGSLGVGAKRETVHRPELNTVLCGKQLIEIACGFEHCIGLTASGDCYAWGQNRYGQLGIDTHDTSETPQKIGELSDKKVIKICCGAYHSMALTSDGEVFSWGHNTFAQLGDKTYNSRKTPTQVLFRDKIVSISCGTNHSIALTHNGSAYVWGSNELGQLGRPKERDFRENRLRAVCNRPQKIPGFDDTIIIRAVCGPNHTLLLTIEGFVYSFGDNVCGQIGNGSADTQFSPFKLNNRIRIKDVITHWENDFSLAVTVDNRIYVWGLAQNKRYDRPRRVPESAGKSLFDIYLTLAKTKVTYKTLNTAEDIIDLNELPNNVMESETPLNYNEFNEDFNQLNDSSEHNSSENSNNVNVFDEDLDFNSNNRYEYEKEELLSDTEETPESQEDMFESGRRRQSNNRSDSGNSLFTESQELVVSAGKLFLKQLNVSFNNPNNFDLKLTTDDKHIYCHKTILQIRNPNFWSILKQNLSQELNEIKINPKTYDSFYAFIQYMYGIEPEVGVHFVNDLKTMAKHFDEPELEEMCAHHINHLRDSINMSNICAFYAKSINCGLNDLENYCKQFFANNWKVILKSDEFQAMDDSLSKRLMNSIVDRNI